MKVVFRVDASSQLGFGHLMRCLTLANSLAQCGVECIFICREMSGFQPDKIESQGYRLYYLTAQSNSDETGDAQATLEILTTLTPSWLIVDHYHLNSEWQHTIKQGGGLAHTKLMVIDDLCRPAPYADLLLDQSLGRQDTDYKHLPAECKLALGVDYTLLNAAFIEQRAAAEAKRRHFAHRELLVSIGATDPLNLTQLVIDGLAYLSTEIYPKVTIVLSKSAPYLNHVELAIAQQHNRNIILIKDATNMASLMLNADFAIGACGTSSWERACLGLPCLSFVSADNQVFISQSMHKAGLCQLVDADISPQQLAQQLTLTSQPDIAKAMSQAGFNMISGQGCQRLVTTLFKSSPLEVKLRTFLASDEAQIFQWQQAPNIRQFARTPTPPTWPEHHRWFQKMMHNDDHNYIIQWNGLPCGLIRLTPQVEDWEVSILIAQAFHGIGIASRALTELQCKHPVVMTAEISPMNKASIKLFLQAGFYPISSDQYRYSGDKLNA
ncbi:UDP-2,4-diacetamido-2,4,6-trideoxy-beta-L-altropyranose hydrolase [Motilimonas sp. E26]|uniref:UDP-2,4-diacetamido-2,4, 6-trideoxy-beta-L-altropyranose hydrolase n=1 Tax=Motilimonas sp. E26 TaxID=2865674 RepID=UPI001E6378F7|nr:UDP-2,4-diacetamido-2,4,6-trideoxy-beta-L-altropyranose hydrolase [Motilimonas sp. E26]MCE0556226.1 UDP-2,4-diacetamido-2,4,6-trideoxy-beta-L-altropyranose hydrolase [Motilimonas sp. E26]